MFNYVSENKTDLSRIIICQQSFKDKLNFSLFLYINVSIEINKIKYDKLLKNKYLSSILISFLTIEFIKSIILVKY